MVKRAWVLGTVVVSGLAFGLGCQNDRQKVSSQERELADTRKDADREAAETRREAADKKAEVDAKAQRDINQEQKDVAEAQKDVNEARAEATRDNAQAGVGGSGAAAAGATAGSVSGSLKSTLGSKLTVKDPSGTETKLKTDDATRVTHNGTAVKLDDFKEGTQVRVSYEVRGDDKIARDVTVLVPVQKQ